jgi:hypothetical protein
MASAIAAFTPGAHADPGAPPAGATPAASAQGTPPPRDLLGSGPLVGLSTSRLSPGGLDLHHYQRVSTARPIYAAARAYVALIGRDELPVSHGFGAGLSLIAGRRHRAVVDVSYGPAAVEPLFLHGVLATARVAYGLTAAAGYEVFLDGPGGGIALRALLGPAWPIDQRLGRTATGLHFGAGVAWKPW